ncbi:DUF1173 family protein [Cupriavidus sp. AU9028]|uniref:DUF1173 family protein n=1 Tax=Cupriavidus sp. AU9028 TaxID=2871157 RepID=UPI001C98A595|nr:DUF1173 family protein [Cupriavidus sp. AU9028]MBY4898676.1 DUF1173 domain-containing protein [Cupriavidus sp. AU9028]
MITVRIGGYQAPLEAVLENPERYVRQLERAKTAQGFAECGCNDGRPSPKLVIRRHPAGLFLLACWPGKSSMHTPGCPFWNRNAGRAGSRADLDAFRHREGILDVKLDASLKVSSRARTKPPQSDQIGAARKPQRRTAGLLAFLEYAWEQAGLNVWPGYGGRGWSACWSRLSSEMADCKINGRAGADILHIVERWDPARKDEILAEMASWTGRLAPTSTDTPRGLLIGEVVAHKPSQFGGEIELRQTKQRFFLGSALYQRMQRSFQAPLAGAGQPTQRCVAVFLIERPKAKNYLTIVDAAAMLTDSRFLPCDSAYEVAMADYLASQRRAFVKPLRHVDGAPVHPDFILTDTSPESVIEVLGMVGNTEYDTRLEAKRHHYRSSGIPLIEWDPAQSLTAMQLPEPTAKLGEVG